MYKPTIFKYSINCNIPPYHYFYSLYTVGDKEIQRDVLHCIVNVAVRNAKVLLLVSQRMTVHGFVVDTGTNSTVPYLFLNLIWPTTSTNMTPQRLVTGKKI